jgi:site-specific DNA-adenine methylase
MSPDAPVLKAPFPAFGGKSQIADMVWSRFGDVRNYVEPFAFSAAVLLRRPHVGSIETINDLNSYVANFWRAVQADPASVAGHADWPVNEDDLHARHRWLVQSSEARHKLEKVRRDPAFYDVRIAGWWCWGACMWIGSGWCDDQHRNADCEQRPDIGDPRGINVLSQQIPDISGDSGASGRGVNSLAAPKLWDGRGTALQNPRHINALGEKRPRTSSSSNGWMPGVIGPSEKIPLIGDRTKFGRGVQAFDDTHRPQLGDAFARGRGVHANDAAEVCADRRAWLTAWMVRLADRYRPVRVCCGHWSRVCDSDSTLTRLGLTGVFLDPPYRKKLACGKKNRSSHIYANDKHQDVDKLVDEVQDWCLKWGDNPQIRIAVCGLEGEYPKLDAAGWEKVPWKSRGGYGNRSEEGKENTARERVWFNRSCVPLEKEPELFITQ